jgi:peptidoglycan/LPS O-acetylase OafA/YrhL
MTNDFDMYIARTQARLAFFLIIILVLLTLMLVSIMVFPQMKPQSEIINLLVQVVTGVLALAGGACAYFFARHRPPTKGDEDSPSPAPVIITKEISTTSTESSKSTPLATTPEKHV